MGQALASDTLVAIVGAGTMGSGIAQVAAAAGQGQVIGYVGTTGRSTGPHLHFEVLENGVQVNPRNMKAQQGESLKGTDLANFKDRIRKIDSQFASLTRSMKMASASQAAVN